MTTGFQLTGRLVAAARVLTGISRADLAEAAGISVETLGRMEAGGGARLQAGNDADAVARALDNFGAVFLPEADGMGAGVRLRFMRQDVRQIARLEGEGGPVRDDDVP